MRTGLRKRRFRILDAWGVPRDVQFYMNSKSARRLSALYTQENIPQIRAMLTVHLVMETASWLDRETVDLAQKAKEVRLQEAPESSLPEERRDQYLLQSYVAESALEPILDRIYLERYAGEYDIEGFANRGIADLILTGGGAGTLLSGFVLYILIAFLLSVLVFRRRELDF